MTAARTPDAGGAVTTAEETPPIGCAVVVLNWNCAADTVRAVQSLPRAWWPQVVVVDNGSDDWGAQQRELDQVSGVTIVRREHNGGYAAGMNAGVSVARERGMRAVALVNADALPTARALSVVFAETERSQVVGVSQHTIRADGSPGDPYPTAGVGSRMTPRPFVCAGCAQGRHPVRVVTGAAIVVRVDALSALGGIDESFFHYKEEFDLCTRADQLGMVVTLVCSVSVGHARGGSLPGRSGSAYYYKIRNEWLFFRKHRGPVGALLSWRLHRVWLSHAAAAIRDGQWHSAVQGAIHGARGVEGRRVVLG